MSITITPTASGPYCDDVIDAVDAVAATPETWQDCVQARLDMLERTPNAVVGSMFCVDNLQRCSLHPASSDPKPVPQKAKKEKKAKEVDTPSDLKVYVADGRMCMGNEVIVDGELSVNAVQRTPKGTVVKFWVKRRDGEILQADMRPGVMERAEPWNEWLGTQAGINGRINKQSRQALKDYIYAQMDRAPTALFVPNVGHVEAWDVLAFANGWIDAAGVVHRTVDGTRASELLVGGPGNGKGQRKTLYLRTADFGADVPALPPTVPYALLDPALVAPGTVPEYGGPRGEVMANARLVIQQFLDAARVNYGNHAVAMGLGYMMAHAVSPIIYKAFDRFPHLYITGPYQTGKDTLGRYLFRATLANDKAVLKSGSGTTPKLVRNSLGHSSLHPLWLNELRGNQDEQWLDSFIRAAYDRQGSATTNIEQERVDFPVRRAMMLTGEAVAGSGAEFSRYVELHLKPVENPAGSEALDAMIPAVRIAWTALLADFHRAGPAILESIRTCRAGLMSAGLDERRAYGWACVLAGISWFYRPAACDPKDTVPEGMWTEALRRAAFAMTRSKDGGSFARFWEAAAIAKRKSFLDQSVSDRWVWLSGPDNAVMSLATRKLILRTEDATRVKMPDASLVQNELVRLPCFLKQEVVDAPSAGLRQRVTVMQFDLRNPDVEESFPGWVLDAAHRDPQGIFNQSAWDANVAARGRKP
jgi:hypothetical protein